MVMITLYILSCLTKWYLKLKLFHCMKCAGLSHVHIHGGQQSLLDTALLSIFLATVNTSMFHLLVICFWVRGQ